MDVGGTVQHRLRRLPGLRRVAGVRSPLRSLAERLDAVALRAWEFCAYHLHRLPSDGAMTARLRRMGVSGFTAYAAGQMVGHYGRRSFLPTERRRLVAALRADYPEAVEAILATAERLCAGRFALLGSAERDMTRGGAPGWRIDWQRDPISGERYARVFSHWRFDVARMRPGRADIKGPWELSRAQHLVTLGQAYWLSGDETYARCFAGTIEDFIRHNPVGFGVHWACTMDVGLRVVGWLAGLSFFQGSPHLGLRWWRRFLKSLVEHGNFIAANLEFGTWNGKLIVSNHGVSDLFGLYWLALNFPHLDAACVWRGIAETGLEREAVRQILPDGGDFESSVPYHRLVVEMLLSAYALSLQAGLPLSEGYRDRLRRSLDFVRLLRQPGGRQPQIGDADDGRAHVFTGYGAAQSENMDHLLAAGARVLGLPHLRAGLPKSAMIEALFWDVPGTEIAAEAGAEERAGEPGRVDLLSDFGVAVARMGPTYLALTNGRVGTEGVGNHKHNDQLAIEWVVGDRPILVDGGSYTYTQDPDSRNRFRSTATHNTVMIGGEEQHGVNPAWLFRTEQMGEAGLTVVPPGPQGCGIVGHHTAYGRLAPPVTHLRRAFIRPDGTVVLEDLFDAARGHRLQWQFLVHPEVEVIERPDHVLLRGAGDCLLFSSDLTWRVTDGWYSPGYGRRIATRSLVAERSDGPERVVIILQPPAASGSSFQQSDQISLEYWRSAAAAAGARGSGEVRVRN